jgi:hypothetical protein
MIICCYIDKPRRRKMKELIAKKVDLGLYKVAAEDEDSDDFPDDDSDNDDGDDNHFKDGMLSYDKGKYSPEQ